MPINSQSFILKNKRKKDKLRLLYSYMHMLDGGFYDYIQKYYPIHLMKKRKYKVRFV